MTKVVPGRTILGNRLLLLLSIVMAVATVHGAALSGSGLVPALRRGGYVILLRHASSPREAPAAGAANPDNAQHERQLDEMGRSSARAMGNALRILKIPVGQVLSSPTYRALETVRLAQLGLPKTLPELGDSGQSMQSASGGTRGAWLRKKTSEVPASGTDTVIVTHLPNIKEAFPDASDLTDGEALIIQPDGHGGALVIGHIKIDEWARLSRQAR